MPQQALFVTYVDHSRIADAGLLADLARSIRCLAEEDGAGRRWSRDHGYKGYTLSLIHI